MKQKLNITMKEDIKSALVEKAEKSGLNSVSYVIMMHLNSKNKKIENIDYENKSKREKFNLSMDADMKKEIKEAAARNAMTASEYITNLFLNETRKDKFYE